MKQKKEINIDLKQLRSFLEVLQENSFTRASRKLKIGQATISHHIQQLEEMLGATLIDRTSKSFSITAEGDLVKKYAEKTFQDLEKLQYDMHREIFGGTIRIAASTIPATYLLPKIISKITQKNSSLHFIVETSDSREAIELVKEGKADLGIVGKQVKHPSLIYKKVISDEIILIGPADGISSISPGEISSIPLISRENGSGTRTSYEKFLHSHNILPSDLKIVYECTTPDSVKEAVIAGLGYAFISRLATKKEVSLGLIKIIDTKGLPIERNFYSIWLNNKKNIEPIKEFLEGLHKTILTV